ncbi:hypothetical protein RKD44_007184 [Streptomyces collinus]
MFARNSDLYFEASDSCWARASSSLPGLLDLQVLRLDVPVLRREQGRLVLQLGVGVLQLLLLRLQFRGAGLQLGGQPLRLGEEFVGTGVGHDGVDVHADGLHQQFQEVLVDLGERGDRGEFDDAEDLSLDDDGQQHQRGRHHLAEPGGDGQVARRQFVHHDGAPTARGLADQGAAEGDASGSGGVLRVAVGADEPQLGTGVAVLGQVEGAVLGRHQRHQLVHDQLGDDGQVAVALHQAGDTGEVGLEPVLLLVGPRGLAQGLHHGVDVVPQLGDLAGRLHGDRAGQVALGDGGGDLGDRADLAGEVAGQFVDVLREALPGAGDALHLGLAAEPALGADLPGHAGDLVGEGGELVDHRVDRRLEFEDLAARVDVDLLRQVALGHRGRHEGDVAHLVGEVVGHRVDVVGQVLPGAGDVRHVRLAAQSPVGADLPGDPGDLVGERRQRVHHGVDHVGQRRDLALGVDGDPLRQVAAGDRGGHLGDGAHLAGQVGRHHVDVVGEVLPGARHPAHPGLPAQVPGRADLAGHAGDLVGEGGELVDHGVDGVLEFQDLAAGVHGDLLGEVALGHRGGHLGDVADLVGQVARHEVHRVGEIAPGAPDALDVGLAAQPSVGADLAGHAGDLVGEGGELVDHGVDGVLEFQDLAAGVHVDLLGQVTPGDRRGHLGDVTDLGGEVARHGVDRVRQVGPGARDPRHPGLPAEGALRADLPGDPRDLGGEHGQLVHHAVEDLGDVAHQAVRVVRQTGAEVAVPHGRQARQEAAQLLVARNRVDGSGAVAGHAYPRSAPRGPRGEDPPPPAGPFGRSGLPCPRSRSSRNPPAEKYARD